MMPDEKKITVTKDGPYQVKGDIPLSIRIIGINTKGESVEWIEGETFPPSQEYYLCRCGHSSHKPFCDGTHKKIGFDGTETATHKTVMEQAEIMEGSEMNLADAEKLCAYARFCDPNGRIWNQVGHTHNPTVKKHFIQQAGDCPSGRLLAIEKATGKVVEPHLEKSIGIVEDPSLGCSGPLWVRGDIEVSGADGRSYERRNRITLCRCGRSENKPFCNGAHAADPKFKDGLSAEPRRLDKST
jgi:CDGSH-type Zn-finger protein